MKLDAEDWIFAVPDSHDFAVVYGFSGDFEAVGDGAALACQRVVAGGVKWVAYAAEDVFAVVVYGAGFAVHQFFGVNHFAAVSVNDTLMSQADAQRGYVWAECLEDGFADAEEMFVFWVAWTRRDDDAVWLQLGGFRQGDLVVSVNGCFCALLANVLDEVVDETVVVVDDQNLHWALPPAACSSAFMRALALNSVSCDSFSGLESATMPAPT